MFSPARGRRASSDAATICEVNGGLQTAAAYADVVAHGALPSREDGGAGFGFALPPAPLAPPPASAAAGSGPARKRRRLTGGDGAIATAAAKLWPVLGLPPPPPLPGDEEQPHIAAAAAAAATSPDAAQPHPQPRLAAFAWQPHGLLHPLEPSGRGVPRGASASSSAAAAPHLLCACALAPEDVVALYDLYEQCWLGHRLAHPQQKRVASVAWQPQAASILAVGGAAGVCLWRLAFSGSTGALTGAHLLRTIALFGGPSAFPLPPTTLRWHPLGKWVAAASPHHGAVAICDPACPAPVAELPMHGSGGAVGFAAAAIAGLAGSSVHASGIGVVEVSPCGGAMAVGGTSGGLRVYDTHSWQWSSWPRFGQNAPCVCAAWQVPSGHGSPLLADEVKTLVVALKGSASLYVLRVGRRHARSDVSVATGGAGLSSCGRLAADYMGHIDLAHLCPPLAPGGAGEGSTADEDSAASGGDACGGGAATGVALRPRTAVRRGAIVDLAWEPRGERLVVGWAPQSASSVPAEGGGVTVLSTRALPTLQAHAIGSIQVPYRGKDGVGPASLLRGVAFACAAPRAGRENGSAAGGGSATDTGVVVSVAWQNGVVGLVPLLF